MIKKKKAVKIITALAIVTILGIGGTLAYLNSITNTATNTFASDKSISLQLREDKWDGYTFDDAETQDGQGVKPGLPPAAVEMLGFTQAARYTPGQVIPKNPIVKNNGHTENGVPIYTALKVTYYSVSEGGTETPMSYDEFKAAFLKDTGIAFNSNWTLLTNTDASSKDQVYVYGTASAATSLETGATTNALFTEVPISLDLEPGTDGKLPKFNIKVRAYAIQTNNIAANEAVSELLKFVEK